MKKTPTPSSFSIDWRGITLTGSAVFYPGRPGVFSGPPERCYPDEPAEVEVHELKCEGFDAMALLEIDQACEEIYALVEATFELEEPDGPEYEPEEPMGMTDVEADADTLKSAGYGTDEDYGYFGDE
jgi:hypothetical protein